MPLFLGGRSPSGIYSLIGSPIQFGFVIPLFEGKFVVRFGVFDQGIDSLVDFEIVVRIRNKTDCVEIANDGMFDTPHENNSLDKRILCGS